jgi:glycosyltransferase involved in cell wall biosynthesis
MSLQVIALPPGRVPSLDRCAVLVPAWQPEVSLAALVEQLIAVGFGAVVLVNDGSDEEHSLVFTTLPQSRVVTVLTHAVNLGKGRALKTGINHILGLPLEIQAVVTADADGQHRIADIVAVAQRLLAGNEAVVLGTRSFDADVPLRSRLGNQLTRVIFGFITGARIADTQTGLRGFRRELLPELMVLDGERYEYEMTVLAHVCQHRSPVQVPIETVYIEGNRSSHFDPVWDSMRIYFVLVRFYFSAVLAAAVDFAGFSIAYAVTGNILVSVVIGRLSSLVNFALNRRFVFRSGASITATLWRYYALVFAVGALSYGSIWALTRHAHWNVFAAKIAVDSVLSLVSFSMQRTFVFRRSDLN